MRDPGPKSWKRILSFLGKHDVFRGTSHFETPNTTKVYLRIVLNQGLDRIYSDISRLHQTKG